MGRCATSKKNLKKVIFSAYGNFFKFESSPFFIIREYVKNLTRCFDATHPRCNAPSALCAIHLFTLNSSPLRVNAVLHRGLLLAQR